MVACFALFTDMLLYGLAIPVLPQLVADTDAGEAATGILYATLVIALLARTPLA